jgi:hypothetical protein
MYCLVEFWTREPVFYLLRYVIVDHLFDPSSLSIGQKSVRRLLTKVPTSLQIGNGSHVRELCLDSEQCECQTNHTAAMPLSDFAADFGASGMGTVF